MHNFCQTNTQRQQADSHDDTAVARNKDAHLLIVLFLCGSSGFSHKGVGTLPKFRESTASYSFPFAVLVTLATAVV